MCSLFGSRKRPLSPAYSSDRKQHAGATQGSCELVSPDTSLLAGLDSDSVQTVVAAAQVRRLGPNEKLITEGRRANHLFLIKNGNARFYRVAREGEDITLFWLGPGDVIGLASLLAEQPTAYLANAETMSPCELLVWDHAVIRSFAARHPRIMENGLRLSAGYLRNALQRHADLATTPPATRVARSLQHLADKIGRVCSSGIEINVNNEHLSSLSDVSRFTASRVLAGWARSGKVSKQRGKVILHVPDALIQ
jgi:CRP-like cAMP-binding protein